MPSAEIVIDRPLDDVWGYVTTSGNWEKWWGGVLQDVEPGWQSGARLTWESGPTSRISSLVPRERLTLTSPFIESTFRLVVRGDNATGVSISFAPQGGAQFSDGERAPQDGPRTIVEAETVHRERELTPHRKTTLEGECQSERWTKR